MGFPSLGNNNEKTHHVWHMVGLKEGENPGRLVPPLTLEKQRGGGTGDHALQVGNLLSI